MKFKAAKYFFAVPLMRCDIPKRSALGHTENEHRSLVRASSSVLSIRGVED